MNKRTLRTLEYNKILGFLSEYAGSEAGKRLCLSAKPMTNKDDIEVALLETSDASARIIRSGRLSFGGISDIRAMCKSLEVGSTLGIGELLCIRSNLSCVADAIKYNGETQDSLTGRFAALRDVPDLRREIDRCIISEEEIADDASPALKEIRRHIRNAGDKIRAELGSLLNGSLRTYLQDAVITSRAGRYCIPVKAEYKSQVPGMVHDQSKGGSTYFIEPMSVVKLNNELREQEIAETEEIGKILANLSDMAGLHTQELVTDYELLSALDFIFAKGAYALSYKGVKPYMNAEGIIDIRKGRHPLIDPKSVVATDIKLGGDYNQLIITGPNTGGKTVTLKTIGLFTLMAQTGLFVPAYEGTRMAVFKDVFADIGDEQSIEQSLSTFSSHMKNIVYILSRANSECLVLFDELCAGTDPTEGAALATSILTTLLDRDVTTAATTHYSELKIYALSTQGVMNAGCEFDIETLAPTYRLLIGIPGKSNAFAISGKLGLSEDIITAASGLIGDNSRAFEDVIADLEKSRKIIEEERYEIENYKSEIEELRQRLRDKNEKAGQQIDDIIEEARAEAKEILEEAKETAAGAIRNINRAGMGRDIAAMEKERRRLNDEIGKLAPKKSKSSGSQYHKATDFHIGDRVHVISMGTDGTVHTLPDSKGMLTVTIGILSSKVKMTDLVILKDESSTDSIKDKSSNIGKIRSSKVQSISAEINLIGMTRDEALIELDKYLDDANLSRISQVRVVHGKGSGILRNAVHEYLRSQKHVKSFRLGEYGEGDAGVTIVEFK